MYARPSRRNPLCVSLAMLIIAAFSLCTTLQVWVADLEGALGVAASSTLLAVSQATPSVTRVLVFDTGGTLVATFGGAALREGDTCCAGFQLGMPSSLAVRDMHCFVPETVCFAICMVDME